MTWTTRPRYEVGGLAVISAGRGPRLLLIHGVGLRGEAWNAQIAELSDRFEIIAADLPGHGESPLPKDQASLADFSDSFANLLDRPTVVAGHSMGAMIALDLAARYPDAVRGVAALNAIYRRTEDARQAVRNRAASLDGVSVASPEGPLTRWFGAEASPERDACEEWLRQVDPRGYQAAYRIFAEEDGPSDEALRSLQCSGLFLTGGQEPNSTPAMSHEMARLTPEGEAHVIEAAAHMMPMTHAREVNAILRRFVEGCLE